jgi:hypothetical protein
MWVVSLVYFSNFAMREYCEVQLREALPLQMHWPTKESCVSVAGMPEWALTKDVMRMKRLGEEGKCFFVLVAICIDVVVGEPWMEP